MTSAAALHEGVWLGGVGLVAAAGCTAVAAALPLAALWVVVAAGALAGAAITGIWLTVDDRTTSLARSGAAGSTAAAVGALVTAAVSGLVIWLHGGAVLLLLVVLVAVPPGIRRHPVARMGQLTRAGSARLHRVEGPGDARPPTAAPIPSDERRLPTPDPALTVETCSPAELSRWWRVTYVRLSRAESDTQRLALVRLRATLLDRLEREHPVGFGRWLASNPRAAGDPGPFVDAAAAGLPHEPPPAGPG